MQLYLDVFARLQAARAADFQTRHGLQIKTGEGLDAAILKLMRPSWTTDRPELLLNSNGLFFGVWVDAACVAEEQFRFNLHAKKLRMLKGEGFRAREFVRGFRAAAALPLKAWPQVAYPKGPITLFEGHMALVPSTFEADVSGLMDSFASLVPLVDEMLAAA